MCGKIAVFLLRCGASGKVELFDLDRIGSNKKEHLMAAMSKSLPTVCSRAGLATARVSILEAAEIA